MPYWRRALIQDGQAAEAVFWRHLSHFHSGLIVPLNSINFSTSDRTDEINFLNPKFFVGLRFSVWVYRYLVGWYLQKAHPSVRFLSIPLVCSKTFPVGSAWDTGKTAVLAPAPATLETSGVFSDSWVHYPHIYGFVTEIVEMCYI